MRYTEPPPAYADTDVSQLPCGKDVVRAVLADINQSKILIGEPRQGKTSLAWELVKRKRESMTVKIDAKSNDVYETPYVYERFDGDILMFDCIDFTSMISEAYRNGDERKFYKDMSCLDLLVIDDLGKSKITERVAEGLFGVIDKIMQQRGQLVITSNLIGEHLIKRFDDQILATALLARIREYCKSYKV